MSAQDNGSTNSGGGGGTEYLHSPQLSSRDSTEEPETNDNSNDKGGEQGAAGGGSRSKAAAGSVRYLRACDNCRRRKVKCDGGKPACAHCTRVDAPCHYSIKPKSRRMWKCLEVDSGVSSSVASGKTGAVAGGAGVAGGSSSDRTVDDTTARLLARVETMERLLMQRNSVNSPRIHSGLGLHDDIGAAGGAISAAATTINGLGVVGGIRQQQMGTSVAAASGLADTGYAASSHSALANNLSGGHGVGHYHAYYGGSSSGQSAGSSSVVPAKRDIDSGPGEASFSGMRGLSHAGGDQSMGADSHMSTPGGGSSAGLPSLDVIKDLINTLFLGNSYIVDLVHEKTFRRQFAAGTLSPLLLYSSLASAARYSKNPAVRTDPPYSASAVFINKAKSLVVDAIEEPSLGNAQGLMILCMMHFSLGNESVTTFYKALALNMCIILGYNRLDSINGPVQPASNCGHELMATSTMSMDWVDREAARRLWWTIFSIENYSSVCMGLAPSIQAEYCDVNLPATSVEWRQGRPDSSSDDEQSLESSKRLRVTPNPLHQLAAYHSQLSLIFSKVAWLVTRTNSNSEEAVAQFSELNSVLQRWYEVLPKELRLSSIDTVLYGRQDSAEYHDICVLHMRFYTTVIQLNHAIPEFTDDPALIEPGQRKCVIAASRISDLLRTSFEVPVEYRDMNWYMCVFRAAHIHIYRLLSRDAESIARAKQDLAIHRRHLREGGPLWRICYKLLSRLDDMEQMVMLLPAQIPVADLIRLKKLAKNGKSQLVNMQLDSLIKPSLIHGENGENEDLPLLTRAEIASSKAPPSHPSVSNIITSAMSSSTAASSGSFGAPIDSPSSSNIGSASGSSGINPQQNPFAAIPATAISAFDMGRSTMPISIEHQFKGGVETAEFTPSVPQVNALPSFSPDPSMPGMGSLGALGGVPGSVPPINTNIVIDNNMAETLVNYFYMVASNQSQSQSDTQSQRTGRSGSAISLNSPPPPSSMSSAMGLSAAGATMSAAMSAATPVVSSAPLHGFGQSPHGETRSRAGHDVTQQNRGRTAQNMMMPQTKSSRAGREAEEDEAVPLLKTCVMCRNRKVKCGSEKPSCINCVKYKCQCVYQPSIRHMRTKQQQQQHQQQGLGLGTKGTSPYTKPRKVCLSPVAVNGAGGGAARRAGEAAGGPSAAGLGLADKRAAAAEDGLSRSHLMQPVSGFAPVVPVQQAQANGGAPYAAQYGRQQSSSPLMSATLKWRTLPPPVASAAAEYSGGAAGHRAPQQSPAFGHPTARSGSLAGSLYSVGSAATSASASASGGYSPVVGTSGVDTRQIEAAMGLPDSVDNMLKAYFRYQYPSSGVVLEEFFWFRYRRDMLTPLIIYAMLAVAAWNLAGDEGGGAYAQVHESFYRQAKQFVEDAMDEAHLRSVQGLLVLANYEALVGRWGTMWNHTTMARRLAEGIIFRDTDFPWAAVRRGTFDFEHQRVLRAYWHSLINDIWAAVLMDKQIGGIEITLPPRPSYDFTYRTLRLQPADRAPGYHVVLPADALRDPRHGNTAAAGELFLLVGAINNAAYLFGHAGRRPSFETFIDFEMRLTEWYRGLPADVRLDDATVARFTATPGVRADLGEVISTHLFWNFARLLLMRMGLVLSLHDDPALLRNIHATEAFYTTDSRALQFYRQAMPILTPDKAASFDQWLFHFCRCMSLQSAQNVVTLLKLGERHAVHPGHFGAGVSLPLVQVVSVSLGLVRSPDALVVYTAVDHLATITRTLLRLKHWFNTALLLLHLFLSMQDAQLLLPDPPPGEDKGDAGDPACPFPPNHLISELLRRLHMTFEAFVNDTIQAVRMSTPSKHRVDPCISPLLRHLPQQSQAALDAAASQEPEWFKYAPSYMRSAWKRLVRTYKSTAAGGTEESEGHQGE
ncbi:hypothetical protein LPJ53_000636 [Coemansia erecta]|uniref:Zn(2)-C6 fungal-type domain-containing protein n=1 Tax=Coemansia erecta TaxID=147472 RepID=A0A9W8CSY6_9FUNG|nr:hypothetical protein LPJ53_000636 [Coemansia erecta]